MRESLFNPPVHNHKVGVGHMLGTIVKKIVTSKFKSSVFYKARSLYLRARERGAKARVQDFDKEKYWWVEGLSRDLRLFLVNVGIAKFGHWKLAEYLHKSRGTIADWASGRKMPSNESMIQLIRLLLRSLDDTGRSELVELIATDLAENIRLLLTSLGYDEVLREKIYEAARRELSEFFATARN